jgi:hypothetical protein
LRWGFANFFCQGLAWKHIPLVSASCLDDRHTTLHPAIT